MTSTPKALALISGGLDSMLAAKWVQSQNILVEGLNFFTGFCVEGQAHSPRNKNKPKRNSALHVADVLGIKLHMIDIVEEYKNIVLNPRFGYGSLLNPCVDCKVFMIQKAMVFMEENGFDFIITGEVIGQRPKSQNKRTMPLIAKHSGANERLFRPLCAKHFPPSYPEIQNWVRRETFLDFTGRSRKGQIALAKEYNFKDYSQPAGGCCFLTDPSYSAKLLDLWQSHNQRYYELDDILLLKVGRHLRPLPHLKLIIGREQGENRYLEGYRHQYQAMQPLSHQGPFMLMDSPQTQEDFTLAAKILGRYSDCQKDEPFKARIYSHNMPTKEIEVTPFMPEDILPS